MPRPSLVLVWLLASSIGAAQTRTWDSLSGGQWTAAANWTGDDAPDSASESAVFDQFGDILVLLPSAAPTPINSLRIDRGGLELLSDGAATADLVSSGDATIAGDLTLTNSLGGGVHLQAGGNLALEPGGSLSVNRGAVTAASTDLGGDLLAGSSLLTASEAALDLGDLSVGVSGAGNDRVAVDVFDGSTLGVAGLRIGADAPGVFAEVNLTGTTLAQPVSETTLVGRPLGPSDSGRGSLAVSRGGVATLGSLVIEESGSVQTSGGRIDVLDLLEVRPGGTYAVQLDPEARTVELTAQQANLAGVLQVSLSILATRGFEAGDAFRVLAAGAINGGFDTLDAPGLPEGLAWRTESSAQGFELLVVPESAPGDFNFDGVVNTADYAVWRETFGQQGPAPTADANGDGLVDVLDYDAWRLALPGPSPGEIAIPEPGSLALLACLAVWRSLVLVARSRIRP